MKRPESYTEQVTEEAQRAPTRRRGPGRAAPRTWDSKNPATPLRIRTEDNERLEAKARELGLSKDALAAGLVWAALDALESGRLILEIATVTTEVTDSKKRTRIYARREARPQGQFLRSRSETK